MKTSSSNSKREFEGLNIKKLESIFDYFYWVLVIVILKKKNIGILNDSCDWQKYIDFKFEV